MLEIKSVTLNYNNYTTFPPKIKRTKKNVCLFINEIQEKKAPQFYRH